VDLPLLIGGGVVLVAAASFVVWRQPVVAFAHRASAFMREVRGEVRKVSWPSWEDLRQSTVIITIIVIIIGLVIGLMDWLFAKVLIDFFGRIFR